MGIEQTDTEVILTLDSDPSTSVRILLHGATILSWKIQGKEHLWLSQSAILDGSKAVRGGIPLVFPVFGKSAEGPTAKLPQHGFARTSTWEFLGQTEENPLTVQFGLGPENLSQEAKSQWGYDFTLIYTVKLEAKSLGTQITVENTDKVDWDFNVLFHSYFRVPSIEDITVEGLTGARINDKVLRSNYVEQSSAVQVTEEVDRVYESVPSKVSINKQNGSKSSPLFTIERDNLKDVVVWNPWTEKAQNMADFTPKDGFKQLLCVEAGNVSQWVSIKPQAKWQGGQLIKALL